MDPIIQLAFLTDNSQEVEQVREKECMEINNLFNKLISYNYTSKFTKVDEIESDIHRFFDLLLWCEKKCPDLILQLFEMMALQQIQQLHLPKHLPLFFKLYILILTNCKPGGHLAFHILDHKLPHNILHTYIETNKNVQDNDELVEYLGSFLKCYHRIFKPEWLHKFVIQQDYFQLLEVTYKFFNCPEPLTQTTVFNLVLEMVSHTEVQNFIVGNKSRLQFYINMAQVMTRTIKNELVEFGMKISELSENEKSKDLLTEIVKQIEDKASLWEDISRVYRNGTEQLFQIPFSKNVLLPLLVGALRLETEPLFTIKYSLFILRRFLKVIKNFGLLQVLIRIIFVEENVFFWPNSIAVEKISQFNLLKILDREIELIQQQQVKQNFGAGVKKFFEGLLRSKDNHFILMICSFVTELFQNLKDEGKLAETYGLESLGKLNKLICEKLINQISQTHRIVVIQSILNTIIILNSEKPLSSELEGQFIFIFKKVIDEIKITLKSKSDLWDFIVQINEYELLKVNTIKLGSLEDRKKFDQIFKIVFLWDIKQQESNFFSFYSCIPDSVEDHFRYLYSKFLLLRKANSYLVDGKQQKNLIVEYYSKFSQQPPFSPGNILSILQIKSHFHECQIIDGKFIIPALWIVDDNFFILGHWDKSKKQLKIIMAIKYKHISTELTTKKEKIMLSLNVKAYDYKTERLTYKNSITIKGIQALMPLIVANQIKVREREMVFITSSIKKTEETLPIPSLI